MVSAGERFTCRIGRAKSQAIAKLLAMKLLWVKSGTLVPPDSGGTIRSFNLLKELAKKHEITLFLFYGAHQNDQHSELNRIFTDVVTLPLPLPAKKRGVAEALAYARNFLSPWPYSVSKYCRPEAMSRLRKLLHERKFDVLICDFLFATEAVPWDFPLPKILFTHNVEEIIWRRSFEVALSPVWKLVAWREFRRMSTVERKYVRLADQVLAVSENDRHHFCTYAPPEKITVVPTGVDVDYFYPLPRREQPDRLVFTGSMDSLANEDAILYLHGSILPLIRKEIPQAQAWVVGRSPSQRLRNLSAQDAGIHVTGSVEDVRPFIAESPVYVVPIRIGGGTRIKIFEAMAMGKAVVSTSVGAEGLPVTHGKDILLADTPEEFAAQTVRLLHDKSARDALGASARRLVEENYSWAAVVGSIDAVLQKALAIPAL
jgi:glycosyltransferase involved in cell wall biosynthesis